MALNFMSSTAINLSGRFIGDPKLKGFCAFNGFMTQWFIVQTDYWVLMIATCTLFTVAGWKSQASWVQKHPLRVFSGPVIVSGIWACIGLGLHAYANIGACKSFATPLGFSV
jgi:hypothetical protein